jgi:hypothetical protein
LEGFGGRRDDRMYEKNCEEGRILPRHLNENNGGKTMTTMDAQME